MSIRFLASKLETTHFRKGCGRSKWPVIVMGKCLEWDVRGADFFVVDFSVNAYKDSADGRGGI